MKVREEIERKKEEEKRGKGKGERSEIGAEVFMVTKLICLLVFIVLDFFVNLITSVI